MIFSHHLLKQPLNYEVVLKTRKIKKSKSILKDNLIYFQIEIYYL